MTVAAASLAGCLSYSPTSRSAALPNQGTPLPAPREGLEPAGWLSPARKSGPLLYVAAEQDNEILIYPENGYNQSPVGMITSGVAKPYGLFVDQSGSLYVSNQNPPTVTVYAPGSTDPSVTYSEGLERPLYSIVDQYGDLFVGNSSGYQCGTGTIVEYKTGSQNPYQTLSVPGREVDGMDFDQQGNLYAAYRRCGRRGGIVKFAPGSTEGQRLDIKVYQPQGLIVDDDGNILVADSGSGAPRLDFYRVGKRYPALKFKLPFLNYPVQLAITSDESRLFVSCFNEGHVFVTDYPLSASSTWTVEDNAPGQPQGIALSNGQTF
jgi:hypothetical protein